MHAPINNAALAKFVALQMLDEALEQDRSPRRSRGLRARVFSRRTRSADAVERWRPSPTGRLAEEGS